MLVYLGPFFVPTFCTLAGATKYDNTIPTQLPVSEAMFTLLQQNQECRPMYFDISKPPVAMKISCTNSCHGNHVLSLTCQTNQVATLIFPQFFGYLYRIRWTRWTSSVLFFLPFDLVKYLVIIPHWIPSFALWCWSNKKGENWTWEQFGFESHHHRNQLTSYISLQIFKKHLATYIFTLAYRWVGKVTLPIRTWWETVPLMGVCRD